MRGRNFTDCIDLRELTNVVLFVQESSSSRRCASYCGGGREFPHTLVYTVPGRWVIGGVCGVGGERIRVLGDGCEGTIVSCVLSCVCADLSDPTIQIGVFCEELFICSQNTNG